MMTTNYRMETEDEVRESFWAEMPETPEFVRAHERWLNGAEQNDLPTDVRCAFVDYVDSLAREGSISQLLAHEVTL